MSCKVSIITVCYNSEQYLKSAIDSVLSQAYKDIEYIIVDGASKDGTLDIIKSYGDRISKVISEPDNGIYDAMNKGVKAATGDLVGILNSDDFFTDSQSVSRIVGGFAETIDAVYADIKFVAPMDLTKIVRYYTGKHFKNWMYRFGMMPPHATVYIKRELFERLGYYKPEFKVSADIELLMRYFYVNKINTKYIDKDLVTMRTGGVSTGSIRGKLQINKDTLKACKENGIYSNHLFMVIKYILKLIYKS